jgi:protein arginine kinase activator
MLCEKCKKNNASVFYSENINGICRSYSLCEDCAKEYKASSNIYEFQNFINDFPSSIFSALPFISIQDDILGGLLKANDSESISSEKRCPMCKSTISVFSKTGKAGCPECYKTFSDELRDTLRSIHGNVKHIGRTPAGIKKKNENKNHIAELKNELRKAIAEENFEAAAKIRDEIRNLEASN